MSADFYFDLVTALWLGFMGACIGSFLNVVAYRLPLGMSVVWKPSHCPKCNHPIRARDNVPVLGWLMLGGKCRDCGAPISSRYAVVEAILGAVFFVLAYVELFRGAENLPGVPHTAFTGAVDLVWYPDWSVIGVYLYHCAAVTLLFTMALLDRDGHRIPVKLIALTVIVGLAVPLLAEYFLRDAIVANPFLFPQPANVRGYLLQVVAHALLAILWCWIIAVPAGLSASERFNLAAALSAAGFFLGASAIYRVVFFALFLILFALLHLVQRKSKRHGIDAVWIAFLILLILWPAINATLDF